MLCVKITGGVVYIIVSLFYILNYPILKHAYMEFKVKIFSLILELMAGMLYLTVKYIGIKVCRYSTSFSVMPNVENSI